MHSVVSHSNIEFKASNESISRNFIWPSLCCVVLCTCVALCEFPKWTFLGWIDWIGGQKGSRRHVFDQSTASKSYWRLLALTLLVKHGLFQTSPSQPSLWARSFPFIHVPCCLSLSHVYHHHYNNKDVHWYITTMIDIIILWPSCIKVRLLPEWPIIIQCSYRINSH